MNKRTQTAYDSWAHGYDAHPNPHILLEHDDVLKLVNPGRYEKILDAGCGTGKYASEFYKKGANVTGIDFSRKMLEVAGIKCPGVKFYYGNLERKLKFNSNHFDKINCAQTLKHIFNIGFTLKEFYRILKKGGFLVFSVTHPDMDWDGYEIKIKSNFILSEKSDIFHHKFKDYFKAIDTAGFKINKIVQVPVSHKIKYLLTVKSYSVVKGRYEIVIFKLEKP